MLQSNSCNSFQSGLSEQRDQTHVQTLPNIFSYEADGPERLVEAVHATLCAFLNAAAFPVLTGQNLTDLN